MWRLRTKSYGNEVVTTGGHQRVHDGREFLRPFGAGREHDRTGSGDLPILSCLEQSVFLVVVGQPAMTEYFQMEVGNVVQISFKSDCLFLFAPERKKPLNRDCARQQPHSNSSVLKPMSGKA